MQETKGSRDFSGYPCCLLAKVTPATIRLDAMDPQEDTGTRPSRPYLRHFFCGDACIRQPRTIQVLLWWMRSYVRMGGRFYCSRAESALEFHRGLPNWMWHKL